MARTVETEGAKKKLKKAQEAYEAAQLRAAKARAEDSDEDEEWKPDQTGRRLRTFFFLSVLAYNELELRIQIYHKLFLNHGRRPVASF